VTPVTPERQPLTALLRQHGLPTLAARNTAMIEAVSELSPIVIADLFGIHPGTAHTWAKFAKPVGPTTALLARERTGRRQPQRLTGFVREL